MQSKTLPTLNKAIIKCTVHYTVHLVYLLSLSLLCTKVRDSDVLVSSSRGDRAMKK